MVFGEQGQCSEKGGFVHAVQRLFQIGHAERVVETVHRFVYEYPDRCGADTVAVQYLVGSCLSVVHGMVCFRQIWRKIRHILRPRPVFRVRLQFSPGRRAQDIVKYGFLQPFVLSCFRPIPLSVGPDGVWRGVRGLSRCSLNGLQFRRMNRVSAFSVRITASMLKKKMRFPVHRYRKIVYLLLVFLMSEK